MTRLFKVVAEACSRYDAVVVEYDGRGVGQ